MDSRRREIPQAKRLEQGKVRKDEGHLGRENPNQNQATGTRILIC